MPLAINFPSADTILASWRANINDALQLKARLADAKAWLDTQDIPALEAAGFTAGDAQIVKDAAAEVAYWAALFAASASLQLVGPSSFPTPAAPKP